MLEKKTDKSEKRVGLHQTLIKSFWQVFTLSFRVVGFGFRKLSGIPLKNFLLMAVIFIILVVF